MTKFGRITHVGEGRIYSGSALPSFAGSFLFMHTPFNAELPLHGNTYGELF